MSVKCGKSIRGFILSCAGVFIMLCTLMVVSSAYAGGIQTLAPVEVSDSTDNLVGTADSATEGTVSQQQMQARPDYRVGEMLQEDPGLVVTEHSGEGKANQYFLRGMNLDHGTDIRITVDGMHVNERGNAHGQGYSDLNFMIPELVSGMQYQKGPYYAAYGDFASVGAVDINYSNVLPKGIATVTVGEFNYERSLLADSVKLGPGNLLFAVEGVHDDGPWTRAEDFRKMNGVLRYSVGDELNGFNITAMGYDCYDDASNQIPSGPWTRGLSRVSALSTRAIS